MWCDEDGSAHFFYDLCWGCGSQVWIGVCLHIYAKLASPGSPSVVTASTHTRTRGSQEQPASHERDDVQHGRPPPPGRHRPGCGGRREGGARRRQEGRCLYPARGAELRFQHYSSSARSCFEEDERRFYPARDAERAEPRLQLSSSPS
jgi:hypothetical protein